MLGEEVYKYVAQQIKARQNLYNNAGDRNQTKLNALSNQNAWVKLASGVGLETAAQKLNLYKSTDVVDNGNDQKIGYHSSYNLSNVSSLLNNLNVPKKIAESKPLLSPDAKEKISKLKLPSTKVNGQTVQIDKNSLVGTQLAKFFVLFNGLSSLKNGKLENRQGFNPTNTFAAKVTDKGQVIADVSNSSYNTTDFGTVPMPGIVDFNIKSLNRGSIKKATIKIKAHSREHFEVLELLYLRLGYTVLVEYGNNIYYDEITTTKTSTDSNGNEKEIETTTSTLKKINTTLIENEESVIMEVF